MTDTPATPFTSKVLVGCRVPKDFFITSGKGESDITVHAGSYHLALNEAGIERCNIMSYSSTLPGIAREVPKDPELLTHGAVLEVINAVAHSEKEVRATAAIIFGWLYYKDTDKKYAGFVCEYNGHDTEKEAIESLKKSLNELYTAGYDAKFDLKDIKTISCSIIPKKKYGTALCALCFVNYEVPVLG